MFNTPDRMSICMVSCVMSGVMLFLFTLPGSLFPVMEQMLPENGAPGVLIIYAFVCVGGSLGLGIFIDSLFQKRSMHY